MINTFEFYPQNFMIDLVILDHFMLLQGVEHAWQRSKENKSLHKSRYLNDVYCLTFATYVLSDDNFLLQGILFQIICYP